MRVAWIIGLALLLTSCATVRPTQDWSRPDERALRATLYLAERDGNSFTSHQQLFAGALRAYRDGFASRLRIIPESTSLSVSCESTTSEADLPATSKHFVSSLVALSPILTQCLDTERLQGFTYPQAVAHSVLQALDPHSLLVLLGSDEVHAEKPELQATSEIRGSNGYLRIPAFIPGTAKSVASALRTFRKQGIHGLVLDLRGNGGGLMPEIVKVLGRFAAQGTNLFSVRGRIAGNSAEYAAEGPDLVPGVRMAVLVDRSTSSGGELSALVLHQLRSAIVVGEPTASLNSIRSVYPLDNDLFAVITTATWMVPGDTRVLAAGVIPDVAVDSKRENEGDEAVDPVLARAFAALSH